MRRITPAEARPPRLDPDTPRSPWYDPHAIRPALYLPPERERRYPFPPWQVVASVAFVCVGWVLGWLLLALIRALFTGTPQ